MISFAKKIKKELCNIDVKLKTCCGYSFIYGLLYTSHPKDGVVTGKILNSDVGSLFLELCQQMNVKKEYSYKYEKNRISISAEFLRFNSYLDIKNSILRCGRCKEYFLKGVFLANGAISDPQKSYRLELVFNDEHKQVEIKDLLISIGIEPLITLRDDKYVIYLRKSEAIEDFFANIGATSLAFDIMNSKINKELINNANRVTNCDSANINKSLSASEKYISVITELVENDSINMLPSHLREMALKRIEFKELSFTELGRQFNPPISKSGVYHRLEKILEFYKELSEKN